MDKDKVQQIGEMGLLDIIGRQLKGPLSSVNPMKVLLGFGDDSALLHLDNSFHLVFDFCGNRAR